MSFFNSKPWAKIPTDLLENKAMIQAESELASELKSAPVLLYLAGATKADEDGIFDIGDGEEFSALIKATNPAIVCEVAAVMVKYRIFAHVPESSIYLFAEWEYSTRQNGKSLRNRFNTACEIWKKKQEESSFFCSPYTKIDSMRKNIESTSDKCLNTIQGSHDKCLNAIQGSCAGNPQIRREQIREDEIRVNQIIPDAEKTTHTRVEGEGEEEQPPACEPFLGSSAGGFEKSLETKQEQENQERLITVPNWSIVPESETTETLDADAIETEKGDAISVPSNDKKNRGELVFQLSEFFKTSNVSYNVQKGLKTVEAIADELLQTTETPEQACDLARKMCFEFKKMHDAPEGDRWHNIPLFPAYMAKDAIWAQILSRVSRIYGSIPAKKPRSQEEEWQEVLEERADPANSPEAEFLRFGIDPQDPNRYARLLAAKSARGIS